MLVFAIMVVAVAMTVAVAVIAEGGRMAVETGVKATGMTVVVEETKVVQGAADEGAPLEYKIC